MMEKANGSSTSRHQSVGRALHRPVLSPDGKFVAVIAPELQVHIVSLADNRRRNRVVQRIVLPKQARQLLSSANILRWSPETRVSNGRDGFEFATMWLLLSDGERVIALRAEIPGFDSTNVLYVEKSESHHSNILSDYQFGDQHGRVTFAEFIFSHHQAIILFEMNTHASILSLTKPQRDDVPNPKFPDSRTFAQSPAWRFLALLTRSKGQDQIIIFTPEDEQSSHSRTFSPQTLDAQGLLWAPNGDPVLAVWDSASYGVRASFYAASGHHLERLDITSSTVETGTSLAGFEGLGITYFQWFARIESTYIALTIGHTHVLVYEQDNRNMTTKLVFTNEYPTIVDGSQYLVWNETAEGARDFIQQSTAFSNADDSKKNGAEVISLNSNSTIVVSRTPAYPKVVWLWHPSTSQPHTVICFKEPVRQVLWHPSLPNVLLILTTQPSPTVYVWYDDAKPPAIGFVPLPTEVSHGVRFEGAWMPNAIDGHHPFMLASPTTFDIGFLVGRDSHVIFDSILQKDIFSEDDIGDATEIIDTPSRDSKKAGSILQQAVNFQGEGAHQKW